MALIKHNAKVGAEIACELEEIRYQSMASNLGHKFPHVVVKSRQYTNQPVGVSLGVICGECVFFVAECNWSIS